MELMALSLFTQVSGQGAFIGLALAALSLCVFGALLTGIAQGPDTQTADVVAALTAAAGGGDSFLMTGKDLLVVNNGGGAPITVTLTAVADNFGITNSVHNIAQSVGAGKMAFFGPNTLRRFADANGLMQVTYSGVTTVTVGVFRMGTTA